MSDIEATDVLIIGAGAAGLIAALRAVENGASVIVIERDPIPRGSTALSAGLIPAAATSLQRRAGISDSDDQFVSDILAKSHGEADPMAARALAAHVRDAIEWLTDRHSFPLSVITDFSYPGHSARRMHGLPSRAGAELMDALTAAAETAGILIITSANARELRKDTSGRVSAVAIERPDASREWIKCKSLILACNGYGGNKALVRTHIPELADALYFGHPGNQGDALRWGDELGAAARHLSGYQGHGSVAQPHGMLITWATITEGGFQVNTNGQRFSNEAHGYSEQAENVVAQRDAIAWSIFDARIAGIARQFEDYRNAESAGALITAPSAAGLAAACKLPTETFAATFAEVANHKTKGTTDSFGRSWKSAPQLSPPYVAVRVTGALFHTQGGLVVDANARVLTSQNQPLPNVFAIGGAACGVSGSTAAGYLSGNGLLTAVGYGFAAGHAAAELAQHQQSQQSQ